MTYQHTLSPGHRDWMKDEGYDQPGLDHCARPDAKLKPAQDAPVDSNTVDTYSPLATYDMPAHSQPRAS